MVVGNIALVEPGEIIPCDGIFISGHNVKCDESGVTGESDAIKKLPYSEVVEIHRKAAGEKDGSIHTDCFMISGSKVLEGVGKYVVVVGTKSFNGRIMMGTYSDSFSSYAVTCADRLFWLFYSTALRGDTDDTPLQLKLNNLAELIAKIGSLAGLILFSALVIRFFVQLGTGEPSRYFFFLLNRES